MFVVIGLRYTATLCVIGLHYSATLCVIGLRYTAVLCDNRIALRSSVM